METKITPHPSEHIFRWRNITLPDEEYDATEKIYDLFRTTEIIESDSTVSRNFLAFSTLNGITDLFKEIATNRESFEDARRLFPPLR